MYKIVGEIPLLVFVGENTLLLVITPEFTDELQGATITSFVSGKYLFIMISGS